MMRFREFAKLQRHQKRSLLNNGHQATSRSLKASEDRSQSEVEPKAKDSSSDKSDPIATSNSFEFHR